MIAVYLEDPSNTTAPHQRAIQTAIPTTPAASLFRIWLPIEPQMIKAILHLLVNHARAEICEAAGTTVTEAIHEVMTPTTLPIRVILTRVPGRTSGTVGIHTTLGHRLCLIDWWIGWVALRNRGALFVVSCLGL
jgi:hypothetical protein